MPTFDYKCNNKKCNNIFEVFEIPWDKEGVDTSCPKCKSKDTTKLIGAPGLQFNGEGFYETDYKNKGK